MSYNPVSLASLMSRTLVTVRAEASALEALAMARAEQVHHLPVMQDGVLVGLVCTCNLEATPFEARVATVMSAPVITLDPSATFVDAVSAMNDHDVGSVVLVAEGKPCGIVTRGDLLLAEPALKSGFIKSRCECCGLTRHLRTGPAGDTLCIYCYEPGRDGALTHISAEG
jgi:predicted transcriptional regulator